MMTTQEQTAVVTTGEWLADPDPGATRVTLTGSLHAGQRETPGGGMVYFLTSTAYGHQRDVPELPWRDGYRPTPDALLAAAWPGVRFSRSAG